MPTNIIQNLSYYSTKTTNNQAKKTSAAQTSLSAAKVTQEETILPDVTESKEEESSKKQGFYDPEKDLKEKTEEEQLKDLLDKMRKDNRAQWEKLIMSKKNKSYSAVQDLTRLAAARTVGQVRALKGKISRRCMELLKGGDTSDAVKSMLGAMKKVIKKANTKIKRLKEEEVFKTKIEAAQRIRAEESKIKLEKELMSRRRNRKANEQADIAEAINNPHYGSEEIPNLIQNPAASDPILLEVPAMTAETIPAVITEVIPEVSVPVDSGISLNLTM